MTTVKSASVTALDASTPILNTRGEGAKYDVREIDDFAALTTAEVSGSIIRLVRVPTDAIIKTIILENEALGTSVTADIGVYYSSSTNDSPAANAKAGAVVDADFFASAVAVAAAVAPTNVTNESTTYNLSKRKQPLWEAVGLATDPGGFFDIAVTTGGATVAGTPRIGLRVSFAD